MSRRVLLPTVLLAGLLCASSHAAPLLTGTFNIAGNITVSNAGFNACPAASRCITWTDPPATGNNLADMAASGRSGVFTGFTSGNDAVNIQNLIDPPEVVGSGFTPQPFISFNSPGVTTTMMINFIFGGIYLPTQCGASPAAVGQQCTPPGSLFNFVNNPPGPPGGPQATATWSLSGVTSDGLSTWVGNFTSQFGVPYQTVLGQLAANGSVNNSYSATFTVTPNAPIPEAGTLSLLGLGLVGFSIKLRRRRS